VLFDQPGGEWRRAKKADGYRYTIVNGEIIVKGNQCTGATLMKIAGQAQVPFSEVAVQGTGSRF